MRDLHDGLGGEMVTILALAEQEVSSSEDIAHHVRIALIDMRLIIASLEDDGCGVLSTSTTGRGRMNMYARA